MLAESSYRGTVFLGETKNVILSCADDMAQLHFEVAEGYWSSKKLKLIHLSIFCIGDFAMHE